MAGIDQRDGGRTKHSLEMEVLVDAIIEFLAQPDSTGERDDSPLPPLCWDEWQVQIVMEFSCSLAKSANVGNYHTPLPPGLGW